MAKLPLAYDCLQCDKVRPGLVIVHSVAKCHLKVSACVPKFPLAAEYCLAGKCQLSSGQISSGR